MFLNSPTDQQIHFIRFGLACRVLKKKMDTESMKNLDREVLWSPSTMMKFCQLPQVPHLMTKQSWLVVDLPLWKIWVRQLGWLFLIEWKIKNVSNHQPESLFPKISKVSSPKLVTSCNPVCPSWDSSLSEHFKGPPQNPTLSFFTFPIHHRSKSRPCRFLGAMNHAIFVPLGNPQGLTGPSSAPCHQHTQRGAPSRGAAGWNGRCTWR